MTTRTPRRSSAIIDRIGKTPLVRLSSVEARAGGRAEIWAKCEFVNPGGSVKDRPALQIIRDALARGDLDGRSLLDSTSGNTGVAYSLIGAALGIEVTLVMPANASPTRIDIIRSFGTRLILSPEMDGPDGALERAREMAAAEPDRYYFPDQYSNPSNPLSHYRGTGPEIIACLGDRITHFVAGVGTGGTIMGTGRALVEHRSSVAVIAVQPDDSFHGLEGLRHLASDMVPAIWQPDGLVDQLVSVSTEDGWSAAEALPRDQGISVGRSAGANIAAAVRLAQSGPPGAVIVTVLPDRGDRYLQPRPRSVDYER